MARLRLNQLCSYDQFAVVEQITSDEYVTRAKAMFNFLRINLAISERGSGKARDNFEFPCFAQARNYAVGNELSRSKVFKTMISVSEWHHCNGRLHGCAIVSARGQYWRSPRHPTR